MSFGLSASSLRYSRIAGSILPRWTYFSAGWTTRSRWTAISSGPPGGGGPAFGAAGGGGAGLYERRVDGGRPVGRQRLEVLRPPVPLVRGEAVLGVGPVELDHH